MSLDTFTSNNICFFYAVSYKDYISVCARHLFCSTETRKNKVYAVKKETRKKDG